MTFIDRIFSSVSIVLAYFALAASDSAIGAETKGRWEVNYGSTHCRLIRHLESTDQSYRLEVEKSWSFGGYDLRLYGSVLPVYSSAKTVTVAYGSPPISKQFTTNPYMFDNVNERAIGWNDPERVFIGALQKARYFRLTGPKKLDVALDLPNALKAIKEMEKCEDNLVSSWGFDAGEQRSLTAQVQPSNYPGRWVTSADYPRDDLVRTNEGITTFLLNVGADGSKTSCRIVGSSGFPGLDNRTCELLLSRAAFHPAKDKAGRTVPSFYLNRIRWQVPR